MKTKTYNYVSPVKLLLDITHQLNTNLDNAILKVVHNVGIEVDKEELRKALLADYSRCEKAYWEGRRDAVVHAAWVMIADNRCYSYVCSTCGYVSDGKTNYCPECGAKMDGEDEEQENK